MDLFFVLSGFLVSGLLMQEYKQRGEVRVGRFLVRRGFRIYPAFYLLLLVTAIHDLLVGGKLRGEALLSEVLFFQSYVPGLWTHTWSLSVEEHFYLILAAAAVMLGRRPRSPPRFGFVIGGILTVLVVLPLLRYSVASAHPFRLESCFIPTHLRIDSLLFGVLLAALFHFRHMELVAWWTRNRRWLLCSALVLVLPPLLFVLEECRWLTIAGVTGLYLSAGAFVLEATVGKSVGSGAVVRVVTGIGAQSYSIYLWHLPVREWLMPAIVKGSGLESSSWASVCVYLAASVGTGVVMAAAIERPTLALRDRLFPAMSVNPDVGSGSGAATR